MEVQPHLTEGQQRHEEIDFCTCNKTCRRIFDTIKSLIEISPVITLSIVLLTTNNAFSYPFNSTSVESSLHTNANHLIGTSGINSIGSRNNDFSTGWVGGFSPTQYGSTVNHSYHHHIPTGTIAGINGVNRSNGVSADFPTGWAFSN